MSLLLAGLQKDGGDAEERKPLVNKANPVDLACIWIEKSQTASISWVDVATPEQLGWYELKRNLKTATLVVKWALLLLALFDKPSYCLHDTDLCPHTQHAAAVGLRSSGIPFASPALTNSVAFALYVYMLFHILLRKLSLGSSHVLTARRAVGLALVLVCMADCVWAASHGGQGLPFTGTLRLSRLLRPAVFLIYSKTLRETAGRLIRTIPGFIDVLAALLLCILFFAWTGLVLFAGSEEGRTSFKSWSSAISSLWILFTTANSPDVWLPGFRINPCVFVFFLAFLVVSLYLLSNVLLAAVYDAYKEQLRDMLRDWTVAKQTCMRHAFDLLTTHGGGHSIDLETWQEFFPRLCHAFHMKALANNEMRAALIFRTLDKDHIDGLDFVEFSSVMSVIQDGDMYLGLATKKPEPCGESEWHRWARELVKNGLQIGGRKICSYAALLDCVILADVVLAMRQSLHLVNSGAYSSMVLMEQTPATCIGLSALSALYAAFVLLKLQVRGFEAFWYGEPLQNRFDLFNALPCLCLEVSCLVIVYLTPQSPATWIMRVVVLLHVLRTVRLFKHVKPLRHMTNFVVQLLPTYSRMGMLLLLVYYLYAMVGEQWFGGLIYQTNPALANTAFAKADYWDVNFNDFVTSLVTMFVLMLVNNWTIICSATVAVTGTKWAVAFFVSFFVVANLIVLNILMALILECSSTLRQELERQDLDDTEAGATTAVKVLSYEEALRKVLVEDDGRLPDAGSTPKSPSDTTSPGSQPQQDSAGYGATARRLRRLSTTPAPSSGAMAGSAA